jgi:hypothetical protein
MDDQNDLLVAETVTEILERFDIPHVFPPEHAFTHGGLDEQVKVSFWKRLWIWINTPLGFRRATVAPRSDQQGAGVPGGQEAGS